MTTWRALATATWLRSLGEFTVYRQRCSLSRVVVFMTIACACTEIDEPPPENSSTSAQIGSGVGGRGVVVAGRGGTGASNAGNAGMAAPGAGAPNGAASGGMGVAAQPTGEGIGAVGAACTPDKPRACLGAASIGTLVCTDGKWVAALQCGTNERCDTLPGQTQGTCRPMLALCAGKNPGDVVCDAYTRRMCGAALVRFDPFPCPEHAHCDAVQGAVSCACDLSFKSNGPDACVPDVMCPPTACVPGGHCIVGEADYTCACDPEFEGTGTKQCTAVGICATPTVCSADYVCRSKDMSYVCRGQFADWPMPSSIAGAKALPSYMPTAETVHDAVTNLTWQRNLPPTYTGCTSFCTWDKAKAYCEGLVLEGADDWRLPTMIELVSILDDNAVMPSIDAEMFPNTPSDNFWSASPNTGDSSQAWGVGFAEFQVLARTKTDSLRVRCVR